VDIFTRVLIELSREVNKIYLLLLLPGLLFIAVAIVITENGKSAGFYIFDIGLILMWEPIVARLYGEDKDGEIKILSAQPIMQFIASVFHIFALIFFIFILAILILHSAKYI